MYEESKKIAEKRIREREIELEEFELASIKSDTDIDLSIDEFEEEDEEVPIKFEKRKAGKAALEDAEDIGEVECPFCGELFSDLRGHIQECDFAPDDVTIEDILPSKPKRKKKTARKKPQAGADKTPNEKQACPYCGKEFIRLGRHVKSCPKRPKDDEIPEKE
ncbi:MAG: hypothetical protein ACXABO_02525 [Promethearchaeota archaeon]